MFFINEILGLFSPDMGIDLGTANTLVMVKNKGILVREPTVIAQHKKSKQILAIGSEAKRMIGRTPSSVIVIRPFREGVISDFDATAAMLKFFLSEVHANFSTPIKIPRPRVAIGIPSGVTEVERRAVYEAAMSAGARACYLIEEPLAAAIGANLPITEPTGSMIVDIGGGTTEIGSISLGGLVANRSVRVAGDRMDQDIINYVRTRFNMLIGERTAEEVKISLGSAYPTDNEKKMAIKGRDLAGGLPMQVILNSSHVREALSNTIRIIVENIKDTIEDTPPELVADIAERGIVVAGGGGLIQGIDKAIESETKISVIITEDPLTCVVRGVTKALQDKELLNKVKVSTGTNVK